MKLIAERIGTGESNARQAVAVFGKQRAADHGFRGAAAAVAVAERLEPDGGPTTGLSSRVLFAAAELGGGVGGVVIVAGRAVGEYLRTVNTAPSEVDMRPVVDLVPGELVRDEGLQAGLPENLRQRCGKAERIRKISIALRAVLGEAPGAVALSVENLSNKRLSAGNVAIRFDPHRAGGLPAALADASGDLLEQLRRVFLDPGVLLGLTAHEGELRMVLHQLEDGGEGPQAWPIAKHSVASPRPVALRAV